MGMFFDLRSCGKVWLSDLFDDLADESSRFVEISGREVQSLDRIYREIAGGKKIILSDVKEADMEKLYRYLEKKSAEAVGFDKKKQILSKNYDRDRKKSLISAENIAKSSLFILAESDRIISFDSAMPTPFLFGLCGNDYPVQEPAGLPLKYLLPYNFYLELLDKYQDRQEVKVLDRKLFAGPNVLIPKSPETYEIFREAVMAVSEQLPSEPVFLDLGCGSGILTLLFALCIKKCRIQLTDVLPEAIATARLNIEESLQLKFQCAGESWQADYQDQQIIILQSGHLLNKVNTKFDLISFNAPWVPGKPRNRSELALHDDNQKIVREFLTDAPAYLNKNGKVLLGYSDNGGEDYLAALEDFIRSQNWQIEQTFVRKVQSYQSGRKWLRILVYVLGRS